MAGVPLITIYTVIDAVHGGPFWMYPMDVNGIWGLHGHDNNLGRDYSMITLMDIEDTELPFDKITCDYWEWSTLS